MRLSLLVLLLVALLAAVGAALAGAAMRADRPTLVEVSSDGPRDLVAEVQPRQRLLGGSA